MASAAAEKEMAMKLDAVNIGLIVAAIVLGVTWMSLRNARKQKERRERRSVA